ncbi:MAG: chemotaxis protein CheA [Thermodesulfobacteriota bacterium]
MDSHQKAFLEEAHELLAELEVSLLELEETPDDMELVGRVFRAMHTIKGSGAMFGFDAVAEFTHEVETVFDLVRDNKVAVTQELINLTLSARDQIMGMLSGQGAGNQQQAQEIIAALKALIPAAQVEDKESAAEAGPPENVSPSLPAEEASTYRIRFEPSVDIFTTGTNPLLLLDELRELGDCDIVAFINNIPDLEEYQPEACYTSWNITLTTSQGINSIKDVFIFVEDDCALDIQIIAEPGLAKEEEGGKKLGEILVERGDISAADLQKGLASQKRIGEVLAESMGVDNCAISAALAEQKHIKRIQQKKQQPAAVSSIRVDAGKLDSLVDLVGELVTVQARLNQKASSQGDGELLAIAEEVARLSEELRDNTMGIRMLPIGTTFNKFRRLVRDLSNELGKEIVLSTDGAETELDKTVIDQLNDPMVHLIRNSIDHGIELPGVRQAAGKEPQGRVHLSARHSSGYVLVEISDDGAGLDPEVLRAKAIDKGLLAPGASPTDQEIFALLFAPGFSTAKTISDVSGRGVGMDVVKRGIEDLRGTIEISSKKGSSTSIILKLPLTLAIIDGLLVKIGEDHFVMPLAAVEECIELSGDEAIQARNRNMIDFRGKTLSYLCLRERFKVGGELPAVEKIVITEVNGLQVGLAVDQVIGQHQTVIKSLSEVYEGVKGFSGATILGDGTVALILDINMLVQSMVQGPLPGQG